MLGASDLDAAVKAGILSADQADKLAAFSRSRPSADDAAANANEDERFRLFRGFNDVFLALGVMLVSAACFSQYAGPHSSRLPLLLGAVLSWAFAELLVARHRALLPGIVACASLATFMGVSASTFGGDSRIVAWGLASFAAATLFYARFRFPFALLIAGTSVAVALIQIASNAFGPENNLVYAAALAAGLALFALAMAFDASDTQRATRRSDCGFWLHLSAAPFIVYPLIALATGGLGKEGIANALLVLLVTGVLALVALIVDRRALLVSSLLSLGAAVGYLIRTASLPQDAAITMTLGVLGVAVVVMGLGWPRLREAVLLPFRGLPLLQYLPPVHP